MITTEVDDFIRDFQENYTMWIATLNDGTVVYQDDWKPNVEKAAWLRLKDYCDRPSLHVTELRAQFRDHVERVPSNADGYTFRFGVGADWGGPTRQQYVLGYVVGDTRRKVVYKVPELIVEVEKEQSVDPSDITMIMKP